MPHSSVRKEDQEEFDLKKRLFSELFDFPNQLVILSGSRAISKKTPFPGQLENIFRS